MSGNSCETAAERARAVLDATSAALPTAIEELHAADLTQTDLERQVTPQLNAASPLFIIIGPFLANESITFCFIPRINNRCDIQIVIDVAFAFDKAAVAANGNQTFDKGHSSTVNGAARAVLRAENPE